MQSSIDYISFSPHFFVRFRNDGVVLGYEGLPEKLHLTIAGHSKCQDINIHLTNENGAQTKPRVTVGIANKILLSQAIEVRAKDWIYQLLDPVRLRCRPKRRRLGYRDRAWYIRLDNLFSNASFVPVRQELLRIFWQNVMIVSKTRLKIKPQLVPALEAWAASSVAADFFWQNLRPAFKCLVSAAEFGYWCSEEYTGMVIIIEGNLFKLKEGQEVTDILTVFTGEENVETLLVNYESALRIVAAASDYEDTRIFDNPHRIC